MFEIVAKYLDALSSSGGGWAALVLVLVIVGIIYLARFVIVRQGEDAKAREVDRKVEFEQQLERERSNTTNYQQTTERMIDAFDKNTKAMADFSGVLRPMSETLNRIDRHFDSKQ